MHFPKPSRKSGWKLQSKTRQCANYITISYIISYLKKIILRYQDYVHDVRNLIFSPNSFDF